MFTKSEAVISSEAGGGQDRAGGGGGMPLGRHRRHPGHLVNTDCEMGCLKE